jgi:hypothetical protein
MNYRLMLRSSTATWAPETDEGAADLDDNIDNDEGDEDDQGDEDDDPDPDDQDDEPDGEEDPPARQPTRGQNRIATLSASAKAEKERADRLEAELAEARRRPTTPTETPQQYQARRTAHLATLTEAGRLEFLQQESEQRVTSRLAQIEFNSYDANDKASFQGLCARNPVVAAMEDEVEKTLKEYRANGQNATREAVVKYLLGEKALAKAGRAKTKGQQAAGGGSGPRRCKAG